MAKNNSRIAFITDRGPKDLDPISTWVWQEMLDLAKSGKEIRIYLLVHKEVPVEFHHPRIHIVLGFDLNPKNLMSWDPERIHVVEPVESSAQSKLQYGMGLFLIPGLKHSGFIKSQLAATFFSKDPKNSMLMSFWSGFTEHIYYSHPRFQPPTTFQPVQMHPIFIQLFSQEPEPHWSLEQLENKILIPGSLEDIEGQAHLFLQQAQEVLIRRPWTKFVFLKGLARSSSKFKRQFLNSEFSSHLLFPENLNGIQIYSALAAAPETWTQFQTDSTPLAGLALQIQESKQSSKLNIGISSAYTKSTYGSV